MVADTLSDTPDREHLQPAGEMWHHGLALALCRYGSDGLLRLVMHGRGSVAF